TAGLGAGARPALAAERLHTDHSADHVAIDVDVADGRAGDDLLPEALDARMDAQRQAVARIPDGRQHVADLVALVANDVQDGPEFFAGQLARVVQLQHARSEVAAFGTNLVQGALLEQLHAALQGLGT